MHCPPCNSQRTGCIGWPSTSSRTPREPSSKALFPLPLAAAQPPYHSPSACSRRLAHLSRRRSFIPPLVAVPRRMANIVSSWCQYESLKYTTYPVTSHDAWLTAAPLPCVSTALVADTPPSPCVYTALVAETVPLPCVSNCLRDQCTVFTMCSHCLAMWWSGGHPRQVRQGGWHSPRPPCADSRVDDDGCSGWSSHCQ